MLKNLVPSCARAGLTLAVGGISLLFTGCSAVEAPFGVIDTVIEAPFKIAQSAVDAPFKPITKPMRDAQRRKSSDRYAAIRQKQMDEQRAKLVAEGKIPAPKIGPDGKPIYTSENYLVAVSPISSGKLTAAKTGYKNGAAVTTDHTPVSRPLPPSMGVAIPVPKSKAERKAWKKNGAPAIVQHPAAVHPSMINVAAVGEPAPKAVGAPGTNPVTLQPSISAPTRKTVYNGPGQEPRTDLGATR